ncbi:hypothetical protein ACFYO1_23975 [Nocardia sp. NPDC006044]|uniref:hypothetical protein n=1 Tax=Nocardia sp. NPDC006044 TaxID=3364306 RepID=UPI0036D0961A
MGVSVPEKTLEHWVSQYILYRFRSRAAMWWPVAGVDIDVRNLPLRPGKAVSFEVKTATLGSNPSRHHIYVDLGQLWEYSLKPLGEQPFYVFPLPDWPGPLDTYARSKGKHVSDLAFRRSGPGWWFADWMTVMTTAEVAGVLRKELSAHSSGRRKKTRLLTIEVGQAGRRKFLWAAGAPPQRFWWRDFWDELVQCGRQGWPQRILLPARLIPEDRETFSYETVWELLVGARYSPESEPVAALYPEEGGYALAFIASPRELPGPPMGMFDAESVAVESNRVDVFLNADALADMG